MVLGTDFAGKGVPSADALYDGSVDEGERRQISTRFLRLLRVPSEQSKVEAVKRTRPRVQLGSPPGCPEFDDLTYRRHGMLYVQSYARKGVLRAWCLCGEWTLITVHEIRYNVRDSCHGCEDPSPRLTKAVERLERIAREAGG